MIPQLDPVRYPTPQVWELEEGLTRMMNRREMPVLSYRIPRTPQGTWVVHLRSWVRPLRLTAPQVQALLWGLDDGIDSVSVSDALARRRGDGTQ